MNKNNKKDFDRKLEENDFLRSHSFNVGIAKELGLNAAFLYNNLSSWINYNKKNNKNLHDGKYWTCQSFAQMADYTDNILTIEQLKNSISKLIEAGYIESKKINWKNNPYDQTLSYTIKTIIHCGKFPNDDCGKFPNDDCGKFPNDDQIELINKTKNIIIEDSPEIENDCDFNYKDFIDNMKKLLNPNIKYNPISERTELMNFSVLQLELRFSSSQYADIFNKLYAIKNHSDYCKNKFWNSLNYTFQSIKSNINNIVETYKIIDSIPIIEKKYNKIKCKNS